MSYPTNRGSYPHPVLDASDDVASNLDVFNINITPTVDDVELRFQVKMDDPTIQKLIDEGKARFSFRWICSSTLSSEELAVTPSAVHADSIGFVSWIAQEQIRRTVRVEIKVVALASIDAYQLENQNEDYGDATFEIAPGDVLADGGSFVFEADKLYDPLHPPIGSCFEFREDQTLKRGIGVSWENDESVIVRFPAAALEGLNSYALRPDLQISLIVLPALMATIDFIKENANLPSSEDLSELLWYRAISKLVDDVGSLEDPSFYLAQKILGHPLDRSLTTPLSFAEEEDE